ncbi:MAG: hypothetical protein JW830_16215 [Bacteroidales bacterium]|nr:hypothetical protein [Bacteroidales bacterium]
MKSAFLTAALLFSFLVANAQTTFSDDTDVIRFMLDKTYHNDDLGLEIKFGVIPPGGAIGITVQSTRNGSVLYFINCDIHAYGSFAEIFGTNSEDDSKFKFRLFSNRLVVGAGEQEQVTFYPKR